MRSKRWFQAVIMSGLVCSGLLFGCGKDGSPTVSGSPDEMDASVTFRVHAQDLVTPLASVSRTEGAARGQAVVEVLLRGVNEEGEPQTGHAVIPVPPDGSVDAVVSAQPGAFSVRILFHGCDCSGLTEARGGCRLGTGPNVVEVGPAGGAEFAQCGALEALLADPATTPALLERPWSEFADLVEQVRTAKSNELLTWGELKCRYNPRCKARQIPE